MTDKQCSSCGGFCKKSGCERENVKSKEWVGLTDEEVEGLWDSGFYDYVGITALRAIVRAIEAKLKAKNA